jgi:hypothetical protein
VYDLLIDIIFEGISHVGSPWSAVYYLVGDVIDTAHHWSAVSFLVGGVIDTAHHWSAVTLKPPTILVNGVNDTEELLHEVYDTTHHRIQHRFFPRLTPDPVRRARFLDHRSAVPWSGHRPSQVSGDHEMS